MGRSRKSSALRAQKYYEMKDEARELKISVPEMKTIVEERERRKREEEEALRIERNTRDERRRAEKRKRQEEERLVYYELDEYGRPVGALRIRREFITEPQLESQQQLPPLEPIEPEPDMVSYASNGRSSIRIVRRKKKEETVQVTINNDTNSQPKRSRVLGVSEDGVEIIDGRASPNDRYVLRVISGLPKRVIRTEEKPKNETTEKLLLVSSGGIRTKIIPLERAEEMSKEEQEANMVHYLTEVVGSRTVKAYFGPEPSRLNVENEPSESPLPDLDLQISPSPPIPSSPVQPLSTPPPLIAPPTPSNQTPRVTMNDFVDEFLKELDIHPPPDDEF